MDKINKHDHAVASPDLNGLKIQGQYVLKSKIGNGAFGEVYLAKDNKNNIDVAVKLEQASKRKHRSQLFNEVKIYKLLQGNKGIPDMYWSGNLGDYNIMVMKNLGPSLENIVSKLLKSLTLKTTLLAAQQMLSCIETFHTNLLIHRDIKPDNFLTGSNASDNTVYIIDYGLAKFYKDPDTKLHIPYKKGKKLAGTARYCSIFTHLGIEQSRRDDLEGLVYNLVYMLNGKLPWMGLNVNKKEEKYALILKNKQSIPVQELCAGFPELGSLLTYTRSLKFEEKPDYSIFRKAFANVIRKHKFDVNPIMDWQNIKIEPLKSEETKKAKNKHGETNKGKEKAKEKEKVNEKEKEKEKEKENNNTKKLEEPKEQIEQKGQTEQKELIIPKQCTSQSNIKNCTDNVVKGDTSNSIIKDAKNFSSIELNCLNKTWRSLPRVPSELESNEIPTEKPLPIFLYFPTSAIQSNVKRMRRRNVARRQDRIQSYFFKTALSFVNNEQSNFSADHNKLNFQCK